jgi:hypothetical protein
MNSEFGVRSAPLDDARGGLSAVEGRKECGISNTE